MRPSDPAQCVVTMHERVTFSPTSGTPKNNHGKCRLVIETWDQTPSLEVVAPINKDADKTDPQFLLVLLPLFRIMIY